MVHSNSFFFFEEKIYTSINNRQGVPKKKRIILYHPLNCNFWMIIAATWNFATCCALYKSYAFVKKIIWHLRIFSFFFFFFFEDNVLLKRSTQHYITYNTRERERDRNKRWLMRRERERPKRKKIFFFFTFDLSFNACNLERKTWSWNFSSIKPSIMSLVSLLRRNSPSMPCSHNFLPKSLNTFPKLCTHWLTSSLLHFVSSACSFFSVSSVCGFYFFYFININITTPYKLKKKIK